LRKLAKVDSDKTTQFSKSPAGSTSGAFFCAHQYLLLAILWLDAYSKGIEEFVGYTMPENQQAIGWMLDTGGEGEWDGYKAIFRWDLTDTSKLPLTLAAGDLSEWIAELTPEFLE
jgi:hypothetical protein